jgi:gamma-glutamylputrescine oxidase
MLFPEVPMQCWDSRMIYSYYRLTLQNQLLVGGGSALRTFLPGHPTSPAVIESVIQRIRERFPFLHDLVFTNYWPGSIDITGNLLPLADFDPENRAVHYVMGCAGLPWAAWCGDYAARRVISGVRDMDRLFGWERKLLISDGVQRVMGKIPAFALNYMDARTSARARSPIA